ncbi:MAG: hypothetical protein ACREBU_14805, partial [Nitrososphaera sp.]
MRRLNAPESRYKVKSRASCKDGIIPRKPSEHMPRLDTIRMVEGAIRKPVVRDYYIVIFDQ